MRGRFGQLLPPSPQPSGGLRAGAWAALGLMLSAACARVDPSPDDAPPPPLDTLRSMSPLGTRTLQLLERVVRIDSGDGGETAVARQIAGYLEAAGVETELLAWRPGRASLLARLGPERGPPLVLLSHLDAPPADPRRWPEGEGPFDGTRHDGELVGRGVLGGKGLAVVHANVVSRLSDREAELVRPVVMLAVAGGLEIDAGAITAVLASRPDLRDAELVLTVGGYTLVDPDLSDRWLHWVSVAEPGWAAIQMTAVGDASDPAPTRLARALPPVVEEGPRSRLTPSADAAISALGETASPVATLAYRSSLLARLLVVPRWAEIPFLSGLVRESVDVTLLESGRVVPPPARARAELRCRYFPGTTTGDLRARFRRLAGTRRVFFTLSAWTSPVESRRPSAALGARLAQVSHRPGIRQALAYGLAVQPTPAGPFRRSTDATVIGFWPIPVTPDDWSRIDRPGERVDLEDFLESAERLRDLVFESSRELNPAAPRTPASGP
jgi:acetylornithine deacetylase/succinyl-diaminopimelate desuccinylase-like protein